MAWPPAVFGALNKISMICVVCQGKLGDNTSIFEVIWGKLLFLTLAVALHGRCPCNSKYYFSFWRRPKREIVFWNSKEKKTLLIKRSRGLAPSSDPLARESSVCLRCNADYKSDELEAKRTKDESCSGRAKRRPRVLAPASLTPVPRRRGVQGGGAERPLLVGFQGVSEMTLGRFFFQAPPGFFLTKSKRNGVERLQVCLR